MQTCRALTILCLLIFSGCNQNSVPKTSSYEITGDTTNRVAEMSAILAKVVAPPTVIQDAYFLEEQTGDGKLGPSDFRAFYVIQVEALDVEQWTRTLVLLGEPAEYHAPTQTRDWWATTNFFSSLEFYKPKSLTGRSHGWVGISRASGRIYIFTFTM